MKKVFLLLAMTLCVMVYAVDGLYVGTDFEIGNFGADEISTEMGLRFFVGYEGVFMDEALTLDAEIGFNMEDFDNMSNGLDIEVEFGYYFTDSLGFHLNSYTDIYFGEEADEPESWLAPGLSYNLLGDFPMFFRVDVPMLLMADEMDALDTIKLDFTISFLKERELAYQTHDGFGAEIQLLNILSDKDDSGFLETLLLTPFYSAGDIYFEAEIGLPLYEKGMDIEGLTITPLMEMYIPALDGLSCYLKLPISNIAAEAGDTVIGLGFGFKFAF